MDIAQIIPPGGQWQAVVDEGAVTRSVIWPGQRFGTAGRSRTVVAKINPLGDLDDASEGVLTMGIVAAPAMHAALKMIRDLSGTRDPVDQEILAICNAVIAYAQRPAPQIPDPERRRGVGVTVARQPSPGPWTYRADTTTHASVADADGKLVAQIPRHPDRPWTANAALLAAAPTMLEALRTLTAAAAVLWRDAATAGKEDHAKSLREMAEAALTAIALAEGATTAADILRAQIEGDRAAKGGQ